jgi:hypothetical protein
MQASKFSVEKREAFLRIAKTASDYCFKVDFVQKFGANLIDRITTALPAALSPHTIDFTDIGQRELVINKGRIAQFLTECSMAHKLRFTANHLYFNLDDDLSSSRVKQGVSFFKHVDNLTSIKHWILLPGLLA